MTHHAPDAATIGAASKLLTDTGYEDMARVLEILLKRVKSRRVPLRRPERASSRSEPYQTDDLRLQGTEHDALYDVECSLAELRYYRRTIFGLGS